MQKRRISKLGRDVSVVGLGTWQLGGEWGPSIDERDALAILDAAVESGVTFLDTADVYGDGRSERLIGKFLRGRSGAEELVVATKLGRRGPQELVEFSLANMRAWTDRSRANLGLDRIALTQLHTPPTAVVESDAVYEVLDTLVAEGRIAAYGVSVETCEQALAAIGRPGVASIQIILNAFRQKPLDLVLPAAQAAGVAIIARVPLASGLLAGTFTRHSVFSAQDHRSFNRHGEAFDVGETFSGVDYEAGVDAAQEFAALAPTGITAAQMALRWVIQQPGVTTVIPGARTVEQARSNAAVAELPDMSELTLRAIGTLYDQQLRSHIHQRW